MCMKETEMSLTSSPAILVHLRAGFFKNFRTIVIG